jgi:hypothetical protein
LTVKPKPDPNEEFVYPNPDPIRAGRVGPNPDPLPCLADGVDLGAAVAVEVAVEIESYTEQAR